MTAKYPSLFSGVFKDRKVFITGHTGFKGSWLTLWLNLLGASVIGYSLEPPSQPNLFQILGLENKIIHIFGDVRDGKHLDKAISQHQPGIVFHLAAQPLVRYSYAEPHLTYETNVMGTVNLFEAVRNNPCVRVVVNITSDKCYENKEIDYAYQEEDPMGGFDPYSSSKGCAELVTTAYQRSFFEDIDIRLASVRAGNVVGGGDWAEDRLIPDCVRALEKGQAISVRNPKAVRPWQHVFEPLSGYLWLASQMWQHDHKFDGAWNFAPNNENNISVKQVVEAVIKGWGSGQWKEVHSDDNLHEASLLKLDYSKAKNLLNWQPVYDIHEALLITTAWYKTYYENEENIEEFTLRDIDNYVNQAKNNQLKWALTREKVKAWQQ